jgi:hypothetical protein
MKDKIITIVIKTVCDIVAILFVYSHLSKNIINFLQKFGVTNQATIINIISSIAVLLSGSIIIFLEWLIFYVIFKPINVQIDFLSKSYKEIKKVTFCVDNMDKHFMDIQEQYILEASIYGGNYITNKLIYILGGDIVVQYNPPAYDTEVANGWATLSCENPYKDCNGNLRYNWTDCVKNYHKTISEKDSIVYREELIIKPKHPDVYTCIINVQINSSEKKCRLCRCIFWLIKSSIIKCNVQPCKVIFKKAR